MRKGILTVWFLVRSKRFHLDTQGGDVSQNYCYCKSVRCLPLDEVSTQISSRLSNYLNANIVPYCTRGQDGLQAIFAVKASLTRVVSVPSPCRTYHHQACPSHGNRPLSNWRNLFPAKSELLPTCSCRRSAGRPS